MTEAFIGLAGVLLGVLISEYFRQQSRIEGYAKDVFPKRLEIYEKLYAKVVWARQVADDIIESPDYSREERHEVWSTVVMDIANFTDEHGLYLHQDIIVHTMLTIMGVENIYYIEDEKVQKEAKTEFGFNSAETLAMIREETGIKKVNQHFSTLTKPKHNNSIYVKEFHEARAQYKKGDLPRY